MLDRKLRFSLLGTLDRKLLGCQVLKFFRGIANEKDKTTHGLNGKRESKN